MILAIDPGTTESGWCVFDGRVLAAGVEENARLLVMVRNGYANTDTLAIEMFASMGMVVGQTVFETVRWIGRFQQAWRDPETVRLVYRQQVKLHLCGQARAKDKNVRQALIDKLGLVGTKKAPGPLYGVTSHAWSALAIAVTASETK